MEQCCKIPFFLTFEEWKAIYQSEGLLSDRPPVTRDHWLHPKDKTEAVTVDNVVISPKLFSPHVPAITYRNGRRVGSQQKNRRNRLNGDIKPFPYVIKMN